MRNAGIVLTTFCHVRAPTPLVEVTTPMALLLGFCEFGNVCSATATAANPARPRPEPDAPAPVGTVFVVASANVSPSPPVPPARVTVNDARSPLGATAVLQNAAPAASGTAGVNCRYGPASVAWPLRRHPGRRGEGRLCSFAPVPVKIMVWMPEVSSPLITHVAEAGPARVGENRTVSTSWVCGWITVPSGKDVTALNPRAMGGLDFVIVSGVPPRFPTVKLTMPL